MFLSNRAVRNGIAGGLGGLVGWLLLEPFVSDPASGAKSPLYEVLRDIGIFGFVSGGCIGAALGSIEGLLIGSLRKTLHGGLLAAGLGFVGGAFGLMFGQIIYQFFPLHIVGRSLGWAMFGAVLGLAQGVLRKSGRGTVNAALGGLIGGGMGGGAFDMMGAIMGGGEASRMVALIATGALIGVFMTLVEQVLATASLKIISGKLEGRDFVLDKPMLTVGRNERCDVTIYYDPHVQPHHATITWNGAAYVISPESGSAVYVHNQPVVNYPLQNNDILLLGTTKLIYRTKSQAERRRAEEARQAETYGRAVKSPSKMPKPIPSPPAAQRQPIGVKPSVASKQPPTPTKVCAACGTVNRAAAKFCNLCGRALA